MKRLFVLISLGVHLKFTYGDEPMRGELIQIQQSFPLDQLRILLAEYLVHDPQFRRSIQYMRSVEFAEVWNRFLNNDKVQEWLQYIEDAGLPVNKVIAMFSDLTGSKKPARFRRFIQIRKGGLSAFVDDALKIVSSSNLVDLHEAKKQSNPQYKELMDKLTAPEFGQMMKEIVEDPEVIAIQKQVKKHGIDIEKLLDLFKTFFGWKQIF
ncbi:protein G12-like [Armigeres subalbatus]|uniref:protein G12-like n=1 Tax=Armigeres subalbatus TaxID=124917 RepID=UPI002ED41999